MRLTHREIASSRRAYTEPCSRPTPTTPALPINWRAFRLRRKPLRSCGAGQHGPGRCAGEGRQGRRSDRAVRSRPPQSAGRIGRLRGPGQDLARCRTHRRAGEELRTMGVTAAEERGSVVRARAGAAAREALPRGCRCLRGIVYDQGERSLPGVARRRIGGIRVLPAALSRPQRRFRPGPDHPVGPRRRMAVHAALAPGPARGTERGEGPLQLGDGRCRGAHREVAAAQYPQVGRLFRRRAAETVRGRDCAFAGPAPRRGLPRNCG